MAPFFYIFHTWALFVCQFVSSDIDIYCNETDVSTAMTEHKYITNTNTNFSTYANYFSADTNSHRTQYLRDRIHKLYSTTNMHRTNYFEVGFGPGATVNDIGQYFDNLILLEPNTIFIDHVQDKLSKNARITGNYRIIEDILDDTFDADKYLTATELSQGIDLFIASQCFWYIKPTKWNEILDKIYNLLSVNGMMIITMTADDTISGNIYRAVEPRVQMTNSIKDYFTAHNDYVYGKLKFDIWREEYASNSTASKLIDLFLFYAKGVAAPYGNTDIINLSDYEFDTLYRDMVRNEFKNGGFYTGVIDKESNEEIVEYHSIQTHIVIQKMF